MLNIVVWQSTDEAAEILCLFCRRAAVHFFLEGIDEAFHLCTITLERLTVLIPGVGFQVRFPFCSDAAVFEGVLQFSFEERPF